MITTKLYFFVFLLLNPQYFLFEMSDENATEDLKGHFSFDSKKLNGNNKGNPPLHPRKDEKSGLEKERFHRECKSTAETRREKDLGRGQRDTPAQYLSCQHRG